jgi:hypothetical protein
LKSVISRWNVLNIGAICEGIKSQLGEKFKFYILGGGGDLKLQAKTEDTDRLGPARRESPKAVAHLKALIGSNRPQADILLWEV